MENVLLAPLDVDDSRIPWRRLMGAVEAIVNERATPQEAMIAAQRWAESR
jgi:hypothetical protein